MATFGRDVDVFQQIASGNLKVLKELVNSASNLVKQPIVSNDYSYAKTEIQSDLETPPVGASVERSL